MSENPVYVAYGTPADTSTAVDVIERSSPNIFSTLSSTMTNVTTSAPITLRDRFPQSGSFKISVGVGTANYEVMYVTAGTGTGAGSFTVTRGQDGTTAVAHLSGETVALMVGVQRIESVYASKQITFQGRVGTFRTPGRAGTTGQKIFAMHNATGSPIVVDIQKITVDVVNTVIIAVTVLPPIIRVWKFTAVPTNGTNLTKVPVDSTLSSSSSLTVWGDASADGTSSGTALTATLPAGTIVTQEFAPRLITAAGYEMFDRTEFLENTDEVVTLNALEGVAVYLDYSLATQNPTTAMYVVSAYWNEYDPA